MKKMLFIITILLLPIVVFAETPSDKPTGDFRQASSKNVNYIGVTTISSDTTEDGKEYASTNSGENSLLVNGGTSLIKNFTLNKSGDESGDNSDFYGTNAGILVYNNATLNISKGKIQTTGSHANAVFAYANGSINISDTEITTDSNNSGGIMVTGGGKLSAANLTVLTKGNSSAAIRSDRGGGSITVNGGNYTTAGFGSPVIYSTANIYVEEATLTSSSSEGVVVEGANSVILNKTNLTDTNNVLYGNSETFKNIFLYQSMSGDASVGSGTFTAINSTITTNKGDTFFVTNTTATINLQNSKIVNNDGDFLRIQAGKWGTSGSNGGDVSLNMMNQQVSGNIIVDDISKLALSMVDGSSIKGIINGDNTANNIDLTISSDSSLDLTGDSYVNSLTNEDLSNSNINLNGHKLYVNGEEIVVTKRKKSNNNSESNSNIVLFIVCGCAVVVVELIIFIIKRKAK